MEDWYLACHKTGKHNAFKAQMFLSGMGITVFIPQVSYRQPRSDRPGHFKNRLEQLFPGYLFVCFDYEVHHTSKVACSPGMSHFVRFGDSIRPLGDMIVDELMRLTLAIDPDSSFHNEGGVNTKKRHRGNSNSLTEEQRNKLNLIIQEKNSEERSALLYAFLDATPEDSVN